MLDNEAKSQIGALFGAAAEEDSAVDTNQEPEAQASEQSNTPAPRQDVKPDTDSPAESSTPKAEDQDPEGPNHRVPYNRFKSVIDARNQYEQDAREAQAQLQRLQSEFEEFKKAQAARPQQDVQGGDDSDKWLEDILGGEDKQPDVDPQYQQLEQRLYKFEMAQATAQLDAEVADVRSKYPNVPEQVLYQSVARKPDVSLERVAEAYSTRLAQIEEQAIARYLQENPQAQAPAAPVAAPRMGGKSPIGS